MHTLLLVITHNNGEKHIFAPEKLNIGSELSEKIGQLKMQSTYGKFYQTDIADTEQVFRLIRAVPSLN